MNHDSHAKARALGVRAAQQGRSAQSNPFKHSGTSYLRSWLRGYNEAKREARRAA